MTQNLVPLESDPPERATAASDDRLFDLPRVVSLLARFAPLVSTTVGSGDDSSTDLRQRGEQLARERRLFVAVEAVGLIRKPGVADLYRAPLLENLGVLLRDGSSLHKVRALRAMRFIAADDCLTYLEIALRDPSSWVVTTALRTLFRIGLRKQGPRMAVFRMLLRWFVESLRFRTVVTPELATKRSMKALSDHHDRIQKAAFQVTRGMVLGLLRQKGGKTLALLGVLLWAVAGGIRLAMFLGAGFWNLVLGSAAIAGVILAAPVLSHPRVQWLVSYAWRLFDVRGAPPVPAQRTRAHTATWAAIDYGLAIAPFVTLHDAGTALTASLFFFAGLAASGIFAAALSPRLPNRLQHLMRFLAVELASRDWHGTLGRVANGVALVFCVLVLFESRDVPLGNWMKLRWRILARLAMVLILLTVALALFIIALNAVGPIDDAVTLMFVFACGSVLPLFIVGETDWIVGTIRVRLLWRERKFEDVDDQIAHLDRIVHTDVYPVGARVSFVMQLLETPLADPKALSRLQDLAGRAPHPRIRDALFQVVDAAETRIRRGQAAGGSDRPFQNLRPASPGAILHPYFVATQLGFAAVDLVVGLLGILGARNIADRSSAVGALLAAVLMVVATAPRRSRFMGFVRSTAFTLTALAIFHWLNLRLAAANRIDMCVVTTLLPASAGALAGHLVHALDTEAPLGTRKKKDWTGIGVTLMFLTVAGAALQSPLLWDGVGAWRSVLPQFQLEGYGLSIGRLRRLPTDRVVRVALVDTTGKRVLPRPSSTFVGIPKSKTFSIWNPRNNTERLYLDDPIVKGEVWIAAGGQAVWAPFPNSCLFGYLDSSDSFLILLRPECSASGKRLIALIYGARQSGAVEEQAQPERAQQSVAHDLFMEKALEDTYSPLVRSLWSPPLD